MIFAFCFKYNLFLFMDQIFVFLCKCLAKIGRFLGWDYEKSSVYVCIHLWPLLCVAASLVMLVSAVATGYGLWITACTIYASLNVFGYWAVVKHYYPGTIKEIFELCMTDLLVIAKRWHTSYAVVNLVIYIILFAAIMAFDTILILLIL